MEILGEVVLPNTNYLPPSVAKVTVRVSIALPVSFELLSPPSREVPNATAVPRASVPETAINEHRDVRTGKDEICPATEVSERTRINAVTKAGRPQRSTQRHLRRSVRPPL